MKGRKPQTKAIRRKEGPQAVKAEIIEPARQGVAKPPEVLANPDLSATWDTIVGDGLAYRQQDEPLLVQLVYWHDVLRTCRERMTGPDGRTLMTVIGVGEKGPDGKHKRSAPNPYFKQMSDATAQIIRLSDQLGCTPLARARIGIAETATASMQVDIAQRIRQIVAEGRR